MPVGILAYAAGEPIACCSVAPRETYRELGGGDYPQDASVWAVVCFFANRELRGSGISARLLDAAFEEIGRVGKRRHAMRRWLRPGGARGHSAAG